MALTTTRTIQVEPPMQSGDQRLYKKLILTSSEKKHPFKWYQRKWQNQFRQPSVPKKVWPKRLKDIQRKGI